MLSRQDVPALSAEPMSLNTAVLAARHHPPRPETEAYPWDENDWCVVEDQRWPCDAAVLLSEIESLAGASLDAAWAAAEAALPEGWTIWLRPGLADDGWIAQARIKGIWNLANGPLPELRVEGWSPAAALSGLAVELRGRE